MKLAIAVTLIMSTAAAASGDGHGGDHHASSITSLLAPAVNVSILIGLLVWKLKKPFESFFTNKATEVENTLERASLKSKEAKIMLEGEERKMANLSSEIKSIQSQAQNEISTYEKNLSKETEDKIQKLKVDANSKIQADKKGMLDELNEELLSAVVEKTKSKIKSNKEYQDKAAAKLLQGL
jgi:F0F1-type ATP synthase membrane subunit b/b'